jgi:hypothetical protein
MDACTNYFFSSFLLARFFLRIKACSNFLGGFLQPPRQISNGPSLTYITLHTLFYIHYFTYITLHTLLYTHYFTYITLHTLLYIHYFTYITLHTLLYIHYFTYITLSLGNGRGSRVIGRGSRVIGRGSRVIGRGSKVEVEGQKSRSRVRSRGSKVEIQGSKMGNISFLLNISRILHFWHLLSKF